MRIINIPYLIIGAGPVGLSTAQLLADTQTECLVVERGVGPSSHPAAHVVNARTLEIFRQSGIDTDALNAIANDPADAGHVNYLTRLNGDLIGMLPFERQGREVLSLTPTPLRNISQHRLEPLLAAAIDALPTCTLRYSTEWQSSEQDSQGVTSIVRDLETEEIIQVRSQFVLAADGAASPVRQSLGIEMIGPARLQSFISIYFNADMRKTVAERPGILHFVMDPEVGGVFVAHDIDREWVFMVSYDPDNETVEDYSIDRCTDIVHNATGDSLIAVEIASIGSWHMTAQVAERMRDRRVFLLGDAAHRFPPTGGLGLNTGVADAHNLVWKLDAVDKGWAHSSLLDTYEAERRPVAETNCEQSVTNAFKMFSLLEALELTDNPSSDTMLAALANPDRQETIASAIEDQATHFDMIGLQLGYCYAEGALARNGAPPPTTVDPRSFDPSAEIGCRLPHTWLNNGQSTLDLVDRFQLTLFSFGAHYEWANTIADIDAPIHHVPLEMDDSTDHFRVQCGMEDGALLIRPDQHVAWRSDTAAGAEDLADVMPVILGT